MQKGSVPYQVWDHVSLLGMCTEESRMEGGVNSTWGHNTMITNSV